MSDEYTLKGLEYKWKMTIGQDALVVSFTEGFQPNPLHRFLQRLILGIKWEKI